MREDPGRPRRVGHRALDAAKKGIRGREVVLPRRAPLLEEFAEHLASDAKKLI
jgi:hypothetical protein